MKGTVFLSESAISKFQNLIACERLQRHRKFPVAAVCEVLQDEVASRNLARSSAVTGRWPEDISMKLLIVRVHTSHNHGCVGHLTYGRYLAS